VIVCSYTVEIFVVYVCMYVVCVCLCVRVDWISNVDNAVDSCRHAVTRVIAWTEHVTM